MIRNLLFTGCVLFTISGSAIHADEKENRQNEPVRKIEESPKLKGSFSGKITIEMNGQKQTFHFDDAAAMKVIAEELPVEVRKQVEKSIEKSIKMGVPGIFIKRHLDGELESLKVFGDKEKDKMLENIPEEVRRRIEMARERAKESMQQLENVQLQIDSMNIDIDDAADAIKQDVQVISKAIMIDPEGEVEELHLDTGKDITDKIAKILIKKRKQKNKSSGLEKRAEDSGELWTKLDQIMERINRMENDIRDLKANRY